MKTLISLLMFFVTAPAQAIESLHVVGLFPGKVVVTIDNQHYVIRQGDEKEGVRYIQPQGDDVVLEVGGVRAVYKMGASVSLTFQVPVVKRKVIYADNRGMFHTIGSINSQTIRFLVDTGATTIAMSADQARKLNIQYRLDGKETTARTASGVAKAYLVKLKTVQLGEITQSNVDGLVIVGSYPKQVLLGMSFLNQLKVEKTGDSMVLESR
ncbi:MAG: TIGR02281 family clan AA aspartic protease [Gammaproteobacteria bacterium]|nr:TIGR02281 family clan AA aspartic protease [Gammaproteobacteria bacterium]